MAEDKDRDGTRHDNRDRQGDPANGRAGDPPPKRRPGRPPSADRPDRGAILPAFPRPDLFELAEEDFAGQPSAHKREFASMSKAQTPKVQKLEWARERRGLSQADLERACGLGQGVWSKALGHYPRPILPERLDRAAAVLRVAPEFLAEEGDWTKFPEDRRFLPEVRADEGGLAAFLAAHELDAAAAVRAIELGLLARTFGLGVLELARVWAMVKEAGGMAEMEARMRSGK